MNTISINNPDTNETIVYNEAEVLRFINAAKESEASVIASQAKAQQYLKEAVDMRIAAYTFFGEQYQPGETEITMSVDDINSFLNSIGAQELRRIFSATVRIYVNVSGIEADSKEDAINMIQDDINVELQSVDGDLWVDDIEVTDVSEE